METYVHTKTSTLIFRKVFSQNPKFSRIIQKSINGWMNKSTMLHPYNRILLSIRRRRQWHPTPILLSGKSHGRGSLVGCNPWSRWGSDTTERLHFHVSLSCIGEGNGNPLQCSCLENPRDRGPWWATIFGVAQSRTQLKWLSSSSSSRKQ